jgi:hypothetical protein
MVDAWILDCNLKFQDLKVFGIEPGKVLEGGVPLLDTHQCLVLDLANMGTGQFGLF